MPFLIRWKSEEATVTIRAQRVVASQLLDTHIRVQGVQQLKDGDHPDIDVHTIEIPKESIEYVIEGVLVDPTINKDSASVPEPEPEPKPDKPTEPVTKSKGRVSRERRVRSNKVER